MSRLKSQMVWATLMIVTRFEGIIAYRVNTTIYDTNWAHVVYSDTSIKCNRWVNSWMFWKGKKWTFHSSLNHQFASVTVKFQGTDVWVYGAPASQFLELPPDYKICLYESYHLSSKSQCYQTNITEVYSASTNVDRPVVVFARGGLQNHEHRIVISVADPVDDLRAYNGVKLSHVVYTIERPTPWPVEEDRWRYREVVMHDTHPLLSYNPQPSLGWFSDSARWSSKVRAAEDGSITSWHELEFYNEEDRDQWGVKVRIKAGAAAIYGAPSAYIDQHNLGLVCVRVDLGLCEIIDLKTIYSNERFQTQHEPVLLWRNNALDPSRGTHILIGLVKTSTEKAVFPFQSIVYLEEQEYSSPRPLVGQLVNVTINHDCAAISYNPGRRCVGESIFGGCRSWFDPWTWTKVGPLGSVLTYRSTLSKYRVKEDPYITMSFSGSAAYLYGAPKAYAPRHFAAQHVCLNNVCRVIDVEQAYLHAPRESLEPAGINGGQCQNVTIQDFTTSLSSPHPELEPVLIWSATGLDDKVEHTLRLALAPLPSPDDAVMSFVKVVYTKVTYHGEVRPNPPPPQPDHAYMAPLHPPYATRWAPLDHKPPPPFSVDLPPPAEPPFIQLISITVLVAFVIGFPRALRSWRRKTRETQPLLSGHPPAPNNDAHGAPWGHTHSSPPPQYPNATDTLPNYSSVADNDSNRRQ
ncbi:hypothetical protein OPQ81_007908 [Rhizoctonia solani]|nr:hypothetical protein OPQ81_007908 [Rhizoctonia solani]